MNHTTKTNGVLVALVLFTSLIFGVFGTQALGQSESMQEPMTQVVLVRQQIASEDADKTMWVRKVHLAPGFAVEAEPIIEHPAEEFVYVLEGSATLTRAGEDPLTFVAGEAWHNEFEQAHTLANASDTEPVTLLVVWVGEEGAF